MSIHSRLEYDQSTSHACIPAGGIHLIASIDSASEAQVTVSFFGSTKALHGEDAIPSADTTTHDHSNQQYSITAVSTSTGSVAERYAYSAYGEPTVLDGSGSVLASSAINNRYSYTCREWDATVGLHHFRARWMSPKTGRFLTRDPIGFKAGDPNLYRYLLDSPTTAVDPSGNESWIPIPIVPGVGPINPITGQPVMPRPTPLTPPNYTTFELSMCTAQLHIVANTQFAHGYRCAGQLLQNFLSNNSQSCPSNCADALRQAVTSGVDIPLPPAADRDSMLRGRARCNANTNHYFTYSSSSIFPG